MCGVAARGVYGYPENGLSKICHKHSLTLLELRLLARRTLSTPSRHNLVPPCYMALLTILEIFEMRKPCGIYPQGFSHYQVK